jgi:hypothetical protein
VPSVHLVRPIHVMLALEGSALAITAFTRLCSSKNTYKQCAACIRNDQSLLSEFSYCILARILLAPQRPSSVTTAVIAVSIAVRDYVVFSLRLLYIVTEVSTTASALQSWFFCCVCLAIVAAAVQFETSCNVPV